LLKHVEQLSELLKRGANFKVINTCGATLKVAKHVGQLSKLLIHVGAILKVVNTCGATLKVAKT